MPGPILYHTPVDLQRYALAVAEGLTLAQLMARFSITRHRAERLRKKVRAPR